MTFASRKALKLLAVMSLAATLGACDEDEQGRILNYDQGVYKGQTDTPIDDETREELRQRARRLVG